MKKTIILTLIFITLFTSLFASESDGIFSMKVGKFEVFTLVESERQGNTAILVGADEELLTYLIPDTGFKHAAKNKIPIAGMHIVYPGIVTVKSTENGFKYCLVVSD